MRYIILIKKLLMPCILLSCPKPNNLKTEDFSGKKPPTLQNRIPTFKGVSVDSLKHSNPSKDCINSKF